MRRTTARAVAIGAAAFVLAGSAALVTPGVAGSATRTAETGETRKVPCGSTVTVAPGDRVVGVTALGLTVDLGVVTDGIGSLLSGLCRITVEVVDTAVKPVPVAGEAAADAVDGAVSGVTDAVGGVVGKVAGATPGTEQQPAPANPGPGEPAPAPASPSGGQSRPQAMPEPNSPVLGGSTTPGLTWTLPSFGTGFASMRDYSGIPMTTTALFSPSPGVRYGGQIPGYSPEFGVLTDPGPGPRGEVRSAGRADALPGDTDEGSEDTGMVVILAVLALSGVTAALVRTWVLRHAIT